MLMSVTFNISDALVDVWRRIVGGGGVKKARNYFLQLRCASLVNCHRLIED